MHKLNCINIRIYLKICHTLYQTCKLKKCSPLQSVFISGPSFSFASIGKLETVPKELLAISATTTAAFIEVLFLLIWGKHLFSDALASLRSVFSHSPLTIDIVTID